VTAVVLTGAGDELGRRVRHRIEADPDVDRVISFDSVAGLDRHALKSALDGADCLVHLEGPPSETAAVLDAAAPAGVSHVVMLSTAAVYGAWANNALPLTEDAPLRPNPGFDFAVNAAERERLAGDWQAAHPGTTVAVLRPAVPVAENECGYLARALASASAVRPMGDGGDAAAQYIHLDDLAAAVDLARRRRLDGPYNVAPDGWLDGDEVRALAGRPRLRLPRRLARRVTALRWRLRLASAPPAIVPYTVHPWVVANDRMKAAGWQPTHGNDEAYVAGHRPAPWAAISPRRRQELALGAAVAAIVTVGAGVALVIRRRIRRRRTPTHL
jgi:nucleoside-diphosphate-sugar epimerase